jgi:hypothetical protein
MRDLQSVANRYKHAPSSAGNKFSSSSRELSLFARAVLRAPKEAPGDSTGGSRRLSGYAPPLTVVFRAPIASDMRLPAASFTSSPAEETSTPEFAPATRL